MIHRKRFTFNQCLVLILLFLASMNAFAKYFYFIIIAFLVFLLLNGRKIKIDIMFILLILFSLFYIIFYPKVRTDILAIVRQFAYPICYFMGLNFLNKVDIKFKDNKHTQDKISAAIIIVSLGAFLHYVLNLIINIESTYRNNIDIWSGEYLNATGQAALSVMAIAVFVATIFSSSRFMEKMISIIGLGTIFAYNLILAGRSLIVITMVVMLTAIIYVNITKDVKGKSSKIFFAIIVFVVGVYSYVQNIFGIREMILGSNLSLRMDNMALLEDVRWTRKIQYITKMIEYPFGGGELNKVIGGYAHELFLDVYSDAGILPYLLLLIIFCIVNKNILCVLRKKSCNPYLKLLVLCMYIVLLLEFMIEPILAGMPWMFCAFCFYQGLLHSFCYSTVK